MKINEFIEKYNYKQWNKMLKLKKLQYDIWDIAYFLNKPVMYISGGGNFTFEAPQKNCFHCNEVLPIQYRLGETFVTFTCPCQNDSINHPSIKKLTQVFGKSKAEEVFSIFNTNRTRNLKTNINYWLGLGFDEQEQKRIVKEITSARSAEYVESLKGKKGVQGRQVDYWVNKGYSKEEAIRKVKDIQTTNGLAYYKKKYPLDYKKRYLDRINAWQVQIQNAIKKDPSILERKMVSLQKASKESMKLFLPLLDHFKDRVKIYIGYEDRNEFFINYKKQLYFYDFTIPELNLIIEFNGQKFHPNYKILNEDEIKEWQCLFSNLQASEKKKLDDKKINVAVNKGFNVIEIWDTDLENEGDQLISDLIDMIEGLINEN